MSVVARVLGLRPMQESQNIETLRRVRATQFSQRERMMGLRDRARSDARAGNLDAESLSDMAGSYIDYGGNPRNFAQWMSNQYMTGLQDKTQAELLEAIQNPTRGYDVLRLMSSLSRGPNDPEFD